MPSGAARRRLCWRAPIDGRILSVYGEAVLAGRFFTAGQQAQAEALAAFVTTDANPLATRLGGAALPRLGACA